MKSAYLLVFVFLCALSSTAFAENVQQKSTAEAKDNWVSSHKWVITPSIGRSALGESGDLKSDRKFEDRIGTTFDLSASTPIADRLWVSLGLDFLPAGADTESRTAGDRTTILRDYLGIPIVAKFDAVPFQNGRSAFYLKAGLTPAFSVSTSTDYSNGTSEDLGDGASTVLLGTVGFGTHFALPNRATLEASLTYVHSLTNVVQSPNDSVALDGILLTAGIGFGI